jgi:hypothetical protein
MVPAPGGPRYPAARATAERLYPRFAQLRSQSRGAAAVPLPGEIEALIDAAFWSSLRREESYSPRISIAFLPPDQAHSSLNFERSLALTAESLGHLAPAADRPGIHLGVWHEADELRVWGATRFVPAYCFVIEVFAPGLVAIKYRRPDASAKYTNVAVLEGDQVKILDPRATAPVGFDGGHATKILMEIAVSMRSHQRGGTLLVVPAESETWRESIRHPIHYSVSPKFGRLAELLAAPRSDRRKQIGQEGFHRTVEAIAGLTAVDGATVITDRFEVLAFGAKIRRRDGWPSLENVQLIEPVEDSVPLPLPILQTGGTRHLSAAQFAADQPDALALVASQDGRFTVFAWAARDELVKAHRVEALLM